MFITSLIEELCTKEENNKAGCTLTFGGQFIFILVKIISTKNIPLYTKLCMLQLKYHVNMIKLTFVYKGIM